MMFLQRCCGVDAGARSKNGREGQREHNGRAVGVVLHDMTFHGGVPRGNPKPSAPLPLTLKAFALNPHLAHARHDRRGGGGQRLMKGGSEVAEANDSRCWFTAPFHGTVPCSCDGAD
jgi:hypothetical protein